MTDEYESERVEGLSGSERQVIEVLQNTPELHMDDIVEISDMDYQTVKNALHELSRRSLVVCGPQFVWEVDLFEAKAPDRCND
jgi:DNA-binding MarR family transcriptional regulator